MYIQCTQHYGVLCMYIVFIVMDTCLKGTEYRVLLLVSLIKTKAKWTLK